MSSSPGCKGTSRCSVHFPSIHVVNFSNRRRGWVEMSEIFFCRHRRVLVFLSGCNIRSRNSSEISSRSPCWTKKASTTSTKIWNSMWGGLLLLSLLPLTLGIPLMEYISVLSTLRDRLRPISVVYSLSTIRTKWQKYPTRRPLYFRWQEWLLNRCALFLRWLLSEFRRDVFGWNQLLLFSDRAIHGGWLSSMCRRSSYGSYGRVCTVHIFAASESYPIGTQPLWVCQCSLHSSVLMNRNRKFNDHLQCFAVDLWHTHFMFRWIAKRLP